MKSVFPGFYNPSDESLDEAWKSEETLFVFDTNTLLNLYGYAAQTRTDFFSILNLISEKVWIPYHVGLEYQRRRLSVVRDEKAIFKKVEDLLEKINKIFESEFNELALNRRFPTLHENTEKLHTDIKKHIADYKRSLSHWDKKQPCVRGHDEIREKLNAVFDGKIGKPPENQDILDEMFKEGERRYKHKVPPGYKDSSKGNKDDSRFVYAGLEYDRQYGDLLVWKQLIERSKEENIKAVIFVTDDAKEDWWYIINSRGEKSIGPRAELREEICKEGEIELFAMYNTSGFLDSGRKLLEVDVKDESISDAGEYFDNKVRSRELFESSFLNDLNKYNESFQSIALSQKALKELQGYSELQKALENNSFSKLKNIINKSNTSSLKNISLESERLRKLINLSRHSELDELKKRIELIDASMRENDSETDEDNEEP
jgi:hypothetical protein